MYPIAFITFSKPLEENIGINLYELGLVHGFSNVALKAQVIKYKIICTSSELTTSVHQK